ncbi:MAG: hypothetical protein LBH24_03835 [Clostridiales bacterium]|nr:hypothetical protein [Clostridiales bacterium]
MKLKEIAAALAGTPAVEGQEAEITRFYAGDFLSRVMGRAPEGCGWLTVMNNVNVAGVAVLAGIRAIILCEGIQPVRELSERCRQEGIGLITTPLDVYAASVGLYRAGGEA